MTIYLVIDGQDAAGKGTLMSVLCNRAINDGLKVFDADKFQIERGRLPRIDELIGSNVLFVSEPTYSGLGKLIREDYTSKNGTKLSDEAVAQAYALDRQILLENLILPAKENGISIFQSRGVSTSLVYQTQTLSEEFVKNLEGNRLELAHSPDYLLLFTVSDVEVINERLNLRKKNDNCIFENVSFQEKVGMAYRSEWFRSIFSESKIIYFNTNAPLEESKREIVEFYNKELRRKL